MTISSEVRKAGPFNGNDLTTSFPFTFKVFDKGDLRVVRTMPSGIEADLILDSDYSVALNPDQDATPGGTVTFPISGDPLAEDWKLTIVGDIDALQPTDLTNGGGFYPQVIENMSDRLTMLVQQAQEKIGRALKVPLSDERGLELPAAQTRANKVVGFDSNGDVTVLSVVEGQQVAAVNLDVFDSVTVGQTDLVTSFAFTPGVQAVEVYRNGARLTPEQDYVELTGNTIRLLSGASEGEVFIVAAAGLAAGNEAAIAAYAAAAEQAAAAAEESASRVDLGALDQAVEDSQQAQAAAEGARDVATTQANRAEDEADRAEVARDAAEDAVQYDYLVDDDAEREAITGMTAGQRAFVRDTEHVWRYDGADWVDMGLGPTAGKLDVADVDALVGSIVVPLIGDFSDLVVDVSWRPVSGIDVQGNEYSARGGEFGIVYADAPLVGTWRDLVVDDQMRPVSGMDLDGRRYIAVAGALVPVDDVSDGAVSYLYDYRSGAALLAADDVDYMIIGLGQSYMDGTKAGNPGDGTVTTAAQHPGFALMFDAGVKPDGADVDGYVDLHEQETTISYETPMSGIADVIMSRLDDRLGFKPRVIFANACRGGMAYWDDRAADYGLKRGTDTYVEMLRLVQRATEISARAGRRLIVLCAVNMHGERDSGNRFYGRALDQWQSHVQEDIQRITGQRQPVPMYLHQTNRGGATGSQPSLSALAQIAAPDRNTHLRCVGGLYQVPSGSDGEHTTAVGYRLYGGLLGHFISDDLLGPYAEPLKATRAYFNTATQIDVVYEQPVSVETNDDLINVSDLGAGKGFFYSDGTATPPAITSVFVSGGGYIVRMNLASAPSGRDHRLFIGCKREGGGTGRDDGQRVAVRSTTEVHTDSLLSVPIYLWAAQQVISLTY